MQSFHPHRHTARRYSKKAGKLVFCAALLWVAAPANAQVGFASGSVYHNWMGFDHYAPYVGLDANTPRFSDTFWWSSAYKTYVGNGWTVWEQGAFYFNRGAFGAGPAALVRYTSNSEYSKTSFYPSAALQCRSGRWRVEALIHFRDQWTQNHGRGASLMLRRELAQLPNQLTVTLRTGVTVMRFADGLPDPYGTVLQFGVVIGRRSPTL
jgi:hypothetical protein